MGSAGDGGVPLRDVGPWLLGALDALTDMIVVVDEDWRIIYANHYAVELLGHPRQAITGRTVSDFVHPDDLARAIEVMGRISERDLGVDTTPAMYRLRTADGTWKRVELNASLVASPGGPARGRGPVLRRPRPARPADGPVHGRCTDGRPGGVGPDLRMVA